MAALGAGTFDAAGVRPEFAVVRSSAEQRRLIESGEADLAHTAVDNVAAWHGPASRWAVLRVIDLGLPHRLVAQPRCTGLPDLAGGRIAVDSARSGFVRLLNAIPAMKPLAGTVRFVEVGALQQRLTALQDGTVDACLLGAEQLARALDAGARELLALNDYFPRYPGLTVAGLPAHVASRRDACTGYLAVLRKTSAWCFDPARRGEVTDLVGRVTGLDAARAAAWYAAEALRRTGRTPDGGERGILEAAWRASGRLGDGQAAPAGWYRPDVLTAALPGPPGGRGT